MQSVEYTDIFYNRIVKSSLCQVDLLCYVFHIASSLVVCLRLPESSFSCKRAQGKLNNAECPYAACAIIQWFLCSSTALPCKFISYHYGKETRTAT